MNTLAECFGLKVPACHIVRQGRGLFFCIERYDRHLVDDKYTRVHQEDMCQVLGLPSARKYEKDQGRPFSDCIQALKHYSNAQAPIIGIMELIRWQIFNVICGNSDGHAKNISLIQNSEGHWQLAPVYDLVSTQSLKVYNPDLAFAVGTHFMPGSVKKKDWEAMAEACGISKSQIIKEVRAAVIKLEALYNSEDLRGRLRERGVDDDCWRKLEQAKLYIAKQCKRIERGL